MWKVPVCPYVSSPNLFDGFNLKWYWTHKLVVGKIRPIMHSSRVGGHPE